MGRRGFTLIEVLVSVLLVSVALVGVMGGIRAISLADIKAQKADLLQKLAFQRMNELVVEAQTNAAEDSGDFTEQGYPDIAWTADIQPDSEVANVSYVTVTASQGEVSQSLSGLIYARPTQGSGQP
ncbi:MAG: prepilin-type N-terminal cleavage/methylation domain-containing protein [Armatimonadetes bacterium]|nr:prepilin-type N-terminal cleavage/methylation domain-containing protein [Armatimonadota bacterium]